MKKMKQIKEQVRELLQDVPSTRDCDYRLYIEVLFKYGAADVSAIQLMRLMKSGDVPAFESVSRARRQLQQHDPVLRGELWEKRQGELQEQRKEELGYQTVVLSDNFQKRLF